MGERQGPFEVNPQQIAGVLRCAVLQQTSYLMQNGGVLTFAPARSLNEDGTQNLLCRDGQEERIVFRGSSLEIARVFEALTAVRPGRPAWTWRAAWRGAGLLATLVLGLALALRLGMPVETGNNALLQALLAPDASIGDPAHAGSATRPVPAPQAPAPNPSVPPPSHPGTELVHPAAEPADRRPPMPRAEASHVPPQDLPVLATAPDGVLTLDGQPVGPGDALALLGNLERLKAQAANDPQAVSSKDIAQALARPSRPATAGQTPPPAARPAGIDVVPPADSWTGIGAKIALPRPGGGTLSSIEELSAFGVSPR